MIFIQSPVMTLISNLHLKYCVTYDSDIRWKALQQQLTTGIRYPLLESSPPHIKELHNEELRDWVSQHF